MPWIEEREEQKNKDKKKIWNEESHTTQNKIYVAI